MTQRALAQRLECSNNVSMRPKLLTLFVAGLAFSLSGCTALPPKEGDIGIGLTSFIQKYGPPSSVFPFGDGKRLVYPAGPFGEETYFVESNAEGLVLSWRQVLTEENFKKVVPGMPSQEVTNLLGPCSVSRSLARNRGSVCSYRYRNPFCQWFSIEITSEGSVRSVGYLSDPKCDDSRLRLFRFNF
jgi:hypothetical protein